MAADTFKVRVGVIVLDEAGRLLLARQNQRPFWVLPGGTLEKGESMGDCAVREIKEEANLDVALGSLLYVADFFAPDGRQVVDVIFSARLLGGELVMEVSENLNDIGFFTRAQVLEMEVKPQPVFAALLESWESGFTDSPRYLGAYS